MPSTGPERRDALPVGTILRDFTIQAVIGHGGFGIVYRAAHNELDLTVAIKEYLPVELAVREGATVQPRSGRDRSAFDDGLRRFRDEAQALIDFDSHPSIVACRDFFRSHGTAYLVMAHEDGQSLAELLAIREHAGRPFAESDLLAVMTPLLEGLANVHTAGVLHRDIKPSNILIRRQGDRPVLIDFGAAKQATARFTKSQAPFTEGYAALEQVADAGKLGPWTDLYAIGAVMWRMVAGGNRPWEPPHPVRVEQRSYAAIGETEDPLPSASELGAGRFSPQVLEAIDQCLRLRETDRIQGSHELLEALRVEGTQLPRPGSAGKTPASVKRTGASAQPSKSNAAPAVLKPRLGRRRAGWLVLAGLVVSLGLVLPLRWQSSPEESVRDQASDVVSGGPGGELPAMERGEASDSAERPRQRSLNREAPPESNDTQQDLDPTGTALGQMEPLAEAERGGNADSSLEVRPEESPPAKRESTAEANGAIQPPGRIRSRPRRSEPPNAESSRDTGSSPGVRAGRSTPSDSESRLEANDSLGISEPTGTGSGRIAELPETESGQGSDSGPVVRTEQSQQSSVQPWIRDALANVQDPGLAETPRQERLLANLKLEAAELPPREAGDRWTNSFGMIFVWIPAGTFQMGSPDDEKGRSRGEFQHEVRISEGFWMKKFEVMQEEWMAVMGTNPSKFKRCGSRCPVENVSWYDAQEYIRRLNGREPSSVYRYRLPTEAEWEYAARAGTAGPRHGDLRDVAWAWGFRSSEKPKFVGTKRANRWGLHDMLGNVWEWTADWFGRYPAGPLVNPLGPGTGSHRVRRGGSWNALGWNIRFASRGSYSPKGRRGDIGFRFVRTK